MKYKAFWERNELDIKRKGKMFPIHATMACGGSGGIVPLCQWTVLTVLNCNDTGMCERCEI